MTEEEQALIEGNLSILAWAIPFALAVFVLAFRFGFFSLPEYKREKPVVSFYHLLGAFFLFILSQFVVAVFGSAIVSILGVYPKISHGWFDVVSIIISSLIVVSYTHLFPEIERRFWKGGNRGSSLLFGVLTLGVSYPTVVVVGQVMRLVLFLVFRAEEVDQTAVSVLKRAAESPYLFVVFVLTVILVVPIAEEVLFRGYLQNWLKKFIGRKGAIWLGAVIFSFFHFSFSQGLSNIELLSSLFLLSLFLGFLYEKRGTLWAPTGLHMAFNALNIAILFY